MTVIQRLNEAAVVPMGAIPTERLVAQNLKSFEELLGAGVTWHSIALGLVKWRHRDGRPISADHLRSAFSRSRRRRDMNADLPRSSGPKKSVTTVAQSERPPAQHQDHNGGLKAQQPVEQSGLRAQLGQTLNLRNIEED